MLYLIKQNGELFVTRNMEDRKIVWKGSYSDDLVTEHLHDWLMDAATDEVVELQEKFSFCSIERLFEDYLLYYWDNDDEKGLVKWNVAGIESPMRAMKEDKLNITVKYALEIFSTIQQAKKWEKQKNWQELDRVLQNLENEDYGYLPFPEIQYFEEDIMGCASGAYPTIENDDDYKAFLEDYINNFNSGYYESEHGWYQALDCFGNLSKEMVEYTLNRIKKEDAKEHDADERIISKLKNQYSGNDEITGSLPE